MIKHYRSAIACVWWSLFLADGFIGCNQLTRSHYSQLMKDADAKSEQGNFERAIKCHEAALDDSRRCAEIHYTLALVYDDKLNDPVSALHHFRRCLALSPNGAHANDVKNSIKRDEVAVLTALSGDSVVTRTEAARLRNENLKELEERSKMSRSATDKVQARNASSKKTASAKSKGRTYIVQSGDTLAWISRKFYKCSARWEEIRDANKENLRDPAKLTVGQSLVIP